MLQVGPYTAIISDSVNLPNTSTDASAADDHVTPKHISHIEKRQIERTNFSTEWKTRIFWLTPHQKYRLKMNLPRDVNRLRQALKCQKHVAKTTYLSKENGVCVSCGVNYWAQRDSWRRETWLKCVTCRKWAHELCGNLDHVCVGVLVARTMND